MAEAQVFTADAAQEVIDSVVKSVPADQIDATFKSDSIGGWHSVRHLPAITVANRTQT